MNTYTNKDLEKLLGEKGHVIRYWEKEIPMIQPQKDGSGKFLYSTRDVQLLLRVKYLVHTKKYTLEGARDALLEELSGDNQDRKADIEAFRSELLHIYYTNKDRGSDDEYSV
jgi:DNA-binding transcriptional MerR regulator